MLTSEQFSDLIHLFTERRQARANGGEILDSVNQDNDEVKMNSTDAGSSTASLRQKQRTGQAILSLQ